MEKKEIIEVIISALSAIATFSAVVVALWQAKYQYKKKLKITITESMRIPERNGIFDDAIKVLEVKISNIGNRDVIISDWGIYLSRKQQLQVFNITDNEFPKTLKPEESVYIRSSLFNLKQGLAENKELIKNEHKKLKIYLNDSTGKKYIAKSFRKIDSYIKLKKEDIFIPKETLNKI